MFSSLPGTPSAPLIFTRLSSCLKPFACVWLSFHDGILGFRRRSSISFAPSAVSSRWDQPSKDARGMNGGGWEGRKGDWHVPTMEDSGLKGKLPYSAAYAFLFLINLFIFGCVGSSLLRAGFL